MDGKASEIGLNTGRKQEKKECREHNEGEANWVGHGPIRSTATGPM